MLCVFGGRVMEAYVHGTIGNVLAFLNPMFSNIFLFMYLFIVTHSKNRVFKNLLYFLALDFLENLPETLSSLDICYVTVTFSFFSFTI